MFYQLTGNVLLTAPSYVVLDVGGVGFKLTASGRTIGAASDKKGAAMTLLTELSVREDALELFGFATEDEKTAFRLLTGVSGVGPKAAMSVLSLYSPEQLAMAVSTEDAKALSRAPGVGGKIAARIVLELKDRIGKEYAGADYGEAASAGAAGGTDKFSDALNTLLVLNYSRSEAMSALKTVDTASLSLEDIVREALKKLSKGVL